MERDDSMRFTSAELWVAGNVSVVHHSRNEILAIILIQLNYHYFKFESSKINSRIMSENNSSALVVKDMQLTQSVEDKLIVLLPRNIQNNLIIARSGFLDTLLKFAKDTIVNLNDFLKN